MNNSKVKKAFTLTASGMLAVVLIVAFQFGWFNNLLAQISTPNIGAANAPVQMSQSATALNSAIVAAADAVNPTIVSISVVSEVSVGSGIQGFEGIDPFEFFFGPRINPRDKGDNKDDYKQKQQSAGSGVIVTKDGYIVTNCHVVKNATENGITVTLWNKKEYSAKLIGVDSLSDLAVVKIESDTDLTPAHFGNADSLKAGMLVIAVGNPLGLNHTVTQGIISALGRDRIGGSTNSYAIENFIQTDAAINPGNSGGGLFDLNGSLIGINTLIATSTGAFVGYGFAIPVDLVKSTVQDIISTGKVNRGYIGAGVVNMDDKFAKHLGLDKVTGVLVQNVKKDSPAEKAGVQETDVILKVNGREVNSVAELRGNINKYRAGDVVTLTLWRDGKEITKKCKLEAANGEEVAETNSEDTGDKPSDNGVVSFDKLGFSIEALTKEMKTRYDVSDGVYVKSVNRYSPAADRNLFAGCVITKVDRETIKTTSQFKKIVDSKKKGETILLRVQTRDKSSIAIVLEIP